MRVSGTPVPIYGGDWTIIPTCYGCMFLGDDDLMCEGYDSVWAAGRTAAILTPCAERRESLYWKMLKDPKRQKPGIIPVPIVYVAGEFMDIPQRGNIGANNVGLVTLPDGSTPVAEFKALFVSAKLLKQGDPWYADLGIAKLVREGRVHVLHSVKEVEEVCKGVVDAIRKGPQRVLPDEPSCDEMRLEEVYNM